ncbi:MAG TPA: class I SAM-dependent RNA methyltransferase [Candidatus Absconditabacterales bacterium]|nr:class I SAM-dependent RNA methyltransferase [Candidatus Absconditabacterales bacterium]
MNLFLSCPTGFEALIKTEIQRAGYQPGEQISGGIFFDGDQQAISKINLRSRVGNKLFLVTKQGYTSTFDELFELIRSINRKELLPANHPIAIGVKSIKSTLHHIPSIQSIGKKAIISQLTNNSGENYSENNSLETAKIEIILNHNKTLIMLNTSGESLYKRGRREHQLIAPIKENVAAALILLSGWKFHRPFIDPMCGSGTIAIEAAQLARNIAPGLQRNFFFEKLSWFDKNIHAKEKEEARGKIFHEKKYEIIGQDSDPEAIKTAKLNAEKAGVADTIVFEENSFTGPEKQIDRSAIGTVLTNPPYGERLQPADLGLIYENLKKIFEENTNLNGGFITSYEDIRPIFGDEFRKTKHCYNGGQECLFYKIKRL